jgi:hypothetical protein
VVRHHHQRMRTIHAIIPLALLEAVQGADALPDGTGADAFGDELTTPRFGMSATVAAQVARYRDLAARGRGIGAEELAGLLRLVSRRPDAALVFADAGRRAGQHAASRISPLAGLCFRLSPRPLRDRFGRSLARRLALDFFQLQVNAGNTVSWNDQAGVAAASAEVRACELYGAAAAELLRRFTSFDGALFHVACRAQGEAACQWQSTPNSEA